MNIKKMDIRKLFDPVQTHAVYKVYEQNIDEVKSALKEQGATRFRIVKTGIKGIFIVCFKIKGELK